jgi:hypothetical protein
MRLLGLIFDPNLNSTVVILLDPEGERVLPIRIGNLEGNAIALGVRKIPTPRPMTHDLIKNILEEFDGRVSKIVVTALKDDTFHAAIHVSVGASSLRIDSRPSDAIALAVRVEAPIFCTEEVLAAAENLGLLKDRKDFDEAADLDQWLERLERDDFGKYEM